MSSGKALTEEDSKIIIELLYELLRCLNVHGFNGRIFLKGAMALYNLSMEHNDDIYARYTQDLDFDLVDEDTYREIADKIIDIANKNKYGIVYRLFKLRELKGVSAGVTLVGDYLGKERKLSIDMNIYAPSNIEVRKVEGLSIEIYTNTAMFATKIKVACSQKLPRRIKDLFDICAFCTNYDFTFKSIFDIFEVKWPGEIYTLKSFVVPANYSVLEHAAMEHSQVSSVNFDKMFSLASCFLNPFVVCANDYIPKYNYKWYHETRIWTLYEGDD